MESLLSDSRTTCSSHSSQEHSLDQPDYLQVPMLAPAQAPPPAECNGTGSTFHLADRCHDDAPLTAHYYGEQDEEEELEEVCVCVVCFVCVCVCVVCVFVCVCVCVCLCCVCVVCVFVCV